MITFMAFVGGLVIGAACAAVVWHAQMQLWKLRAARHWREPLVIDGETFYILPAAEYVTLDNLRARVVVPLGRVGKIEARPWKDPFKDRPDLDMSSRGTPLKPGT